MYAVINIPGSSHFEYYGPDTRRACAGWLTERIATLATTEQMTSLMPQRILPNKEVERWRWRDGTRIVKPEQPESYIYRRYEKA